MLIGFMGAAGAGKDTAAATLPAERWEILKFAGPLKAMLRTLLQRAGADSDLTYDMIEGDLKNTPSPLLGGRTPRYAMQTLGTEWGRDLIHPDLWTITTENQIRETLPEYNVAVTDVRFANEVATIHRLGGVLIRITRPGLVVDLTHPSERFVATLPVDGEIVNDGSFEDLAESVRNQITRLTGES